MPAKDHWAGARLDQWAGGVDKFVDDDPELLWLEQGGEQPAGQSLLLNPDFVALLVRTAFILLEFGSRPLKNKRFAIVPDGILATRTLIAISGIRWRPANR